MESGNKNYYEVLEVPTNASSDDVHKGYLRAKNAYSQDSLALYSLMTKDECDQIIDLIDEAYSILSDPDKRRLYDEARGINQDINYRNSKPSSQQDQDSTHNLRGTPQTTQHNNMSKIVAKKRFDLTYNVDQEMEKRIEAATDFNGAFLQEIREYKGVDIPRMSDMTKVSKTYIRHIEEQAYDKLPAAAYVRGFVYQFAKCLKLNPDLVANSYIYNMKKSLEEAEQ